MDENRRQEAIKELRQIRQDMDKRHVPWKIGHWAEYVYDRLAALREFPEELEDMLGELYDATLDDYATRQWVKHWINKFKRLWQGQETLMEPEPLIDHRPFKGAKGGCPRCKGSGDAYDDENGVDMDCPACKGTGERRKGERREYNAVIGSIYRWGIWIDNRYATEVCGFDRRINEERRK